MEGDFRGRMLFQDADHLVVGFFQLSIQIDACVSGHIQGASADQATAPPHRHIQDALRFVSAVNVHCDDRFEYIDRAKIEIVYAQEYTQLTFYDAGSFVEIDDVFYVFFGFVMRALIPEFVESDAFFASGF